MLIKRADAVWLVQQANLQHDTRWVNQALDQADAGVWPEWYPVSVLEHEFGIDFGNLRVDLYPPAETAEPAITLADLIARLTGQLAGVLEKAIQLDLPNYNAGRLPVLVNFASVERGYLINNVQMTCSKGGIPSHITLIIGPLIDA